MSEEIKKLTKYVKEVRDLMKELDGKVDALTVKSEKQEELINEVLDELRVLLMEDSDDDEEETDDDDDESDEDSDDDDDDEDDEDEEETKPSA